MAFPTLNSIPSVRYSKSSKPRPGLKKRTPSLSTVDIDNSLLAEVQAYCDQSGASLLASLNEAISDWLETSAISRLEYILSEGNGIARPTIETLFFDHPVQ